MSGVLRGIAPAACKEATLDVQVYASDENPWAAPAKMSGISHLIYKWKVLSFSSKKSLIYELETT